MMDSSLRSYNLLGIPLDFEADAVANPSPRLIASAGNEPLRVLIRNTPGTGAIFLAFDEAQLRNLSSGLIAGPDTFLVPVSFGTPIERVFIVAPGQKLYAATNDGTPRINVAVSGAVPISEVLAQAHRAVGIPSRLYTINLPIDPVTGEASQASINNPPVLATAPDWSPMRVTVSVPDNVGLSISEDSDLLRGGSVQAFFMFQNTQATFILAPNQSIYGLGEGEPPLTRVPIHISFTLFTDVFTATPPKKLSAQEQLRVPWANMWQGGDGVCS